MSTSARQKACIPCAESKRRCDKTLPECQRCLDRDMDCAYPQRKRRRRERPLRQSETTQAPELPSFPNVSTTAAAETNLDIGGWDAMEVADLDLFLSDVVVPSVSPSLVPGLSSTFSEPALEVNTISKPDVWFLQPETWDLRHCTEPTDSVTFIALEQFIGSVREMLQDWVNKGRNGFIHPRLYEKGMPTCVQDAFTTLAAYTAQTEAVKETVLQITIDRASELVGQSLESAVAAQSILMQLARVQSLFVYVFIQLFDGSVRARASGERQVSTLRQWVTRMWEMAKEYRGQDSLRDEHHSLLPNTSEFNKHYNASSDMWRLWILIESVRRSQVLIDAVLKVYQTMTKGLAECSGDVMFTARNGLWEAESANKWSDLSSAESSLLVPALQPGPIIAQYPSEAIDEFAVMYWRFVAGQDKISCWVEKSATSSGNQEVAV